MLKKLCLCSLILLFAACSVEDDLKDALTAYDLTPPSWTHGTWKNGNTEVIITDSAVTVPGAIMTMFKPDTTPISNDTKYEFTDYVKSNGVHNQYKFEKISETKLNYTKNTEAAIELTKQTN